MKSEDWSSIKHFKPTEFNNPDIMDVLLIQQLDKFRDFLGHPFTLTSTYRAKDPKQHGLGRAIDLIVPDWKGHLFDLYLTAERFGFHGIGLYRDWECGGKVVGGLHVDMRQDMSPARWLCVRPGAESANGNIAQMLKIPQSYLQLTTDTLYDNHVL